MVNHNDDNNSFIKHCDSFSEGIKYYKDNNFAESILYFRRAIDYLPNDWQSWVRLSLSCVKQAIIDKSDPLFSEAFASAQRGIQHLFESRNLSDEDNSKLDGLEKNGYAAANYVLGICYIEYFGDRHNAIRKYELLKQLNPTFAERLRQIIFKS